MGAVTGSETKRRTERKKRIEEHNSTYVTGSESTADRNMKKASSAVTYTFEKHLLFVLHFE